MHQDYHTNSIGTDYFFIGDGRLLCSIQHSTNPDCSPIGVVIQEPERMSRKHSSLLFHPEFGLQKTMFTIFSNNKRYFPKHGKTKVFWSSGNCICVHWHDDDIFVEESFMVINSCLFRSVNVYSTEDQKKEINSNSTNTIQSPKIEIVASFYANPSLFNYFTSKPNNTLKATGYANLFLHCQTPQARAFERFLIVETPPNQTHNFVYSLNDFRLLENEKNLFLSQNKNLCNSYISLKNSDPEFNQVSHNDNLFQAHSIGSQINNLYHTAKKGLRSVVSKTGCFDACIWQYGMEWGLDAAFVTKAATISGETQLAQELMNNLFSRLISEDGEVMESNRFRDGQESELNGNGAVLEAAYYFLVFSGDKDSISPFWNKIKKVAEYILQDKFSHGSGLLLSQRDFWERLSWMGVEQGFELGHQILCGIGLSYASVIASVLNYEKESNRWKKFSDKIFHATFYNKKFSLLENNTFIHRRLISGKPQTHLFPKPVGNEKYNPYFLGLTIDTSPLPCSPDITTVLPIVYNVAPLQTITNTLNSIEQLWDTNGLGGYARCPNPADPDSKGAWTFGNCFALQAQIIAQDFEKANRTLEWLIAKAGTAGNWFEFYGDKKSPPLPPNGVIVWGWAQWIITVIENICGIKISINEITIAPVVSNLDIETKIGNFNLRVITHEISNVDTNKNTSIGLQNTKLFTKAKLNGSWITKLPVHIALPLTNDCIVEFL